MEEEWYFTFGMNQLDNDGNSLGDYYFIVKAKGHEEARKKMFKQPIKDNSGRSLEELMRAL